MPTKHFIIATLSILLSCVYFLNITHAQNPTNFIVVLVDDLGAHDLSYAGSLFHETPNIDRLADRGTVFTSGYAACAVCSPTRAALQTGKSPARLGITDWIRGRFQGGKQPILKDGEWPYVQDVKNGLFTPQNPVQMELSEITIAERLKEHGYATCYVGKWHLGSEGFHPDNQGYDENIGGCDLGQPPSYFDPYLPGSTETKAGNPDENPLYRISTLSPRQPGEFLTDREAAEAVSFMSRNLESGKPFYLQVANYAVHTPVMGKTSAVEYFREKKQLMAEADPSLLNPFLDDLGEPDAATQTAPRQRNAVYAALVQSVDDALGRILAGVEEFGLSENTIIIFTSDNGGYCGMTDNFPLRSGKGTPYEGGIRVPWIIYVPESLQNTSVSVCDTPISTYDILPTVLDFADIPLSDDERKSQEIEGVSLRPLLAGESSDFHRDSLFWHFPHYRAGIPPYSIIRKGDWKLIRFYTPAGDKWELYHLKDDPRELQDVAENEKEIAQELLAELDAWLKDSGARMPRKTP